MKKTLICTIGLISAIVMLVIAVINSVPADTIITDATDDELEEIRAQFKNVNDLVQSYTLTSDIVDLNGDNSKAIEYVNLTDGLYTSDYTFTTTSKGIDTSYRYSIFAKDDIKTEAVQDIDGEWTIKTTSGNSAPLVGLGTALDVPADLDPNINFECKVNDEESTSSVYIIDTTITADDYKIIYKFNLDKNTFYITHVTINEYSDGSEEPTTVVQQEYTNYNATEVVIDDALKTKLGDMDKIVTLESPYLIESTEE